MILRSENIHRINDVDLCAETFGSPRDPAVLLIMGAMASMVWWLGELCERLAAQRRYVIRYDHRDTGRSSACGPGSPDYTADDLADDALGLLDAIGIEKATLCGMSAARAKNLRSAMNHALLSGGERWFGRLAEIVQGAGHELHPLDWDTILDAFPDSPV